MSDRLVILPLARLDIIEAVAWYEAQRPGLGLEMADCVDAAIHRAAQTPLAFAAIEQDARRVLVRRFPYAVFFKVDGGRLVVLAVTHVRRDPIAAAQGSIATATTIAMGTHARDITSPEPVQKPNTMSVLIVGGTRFIGAATARRLHAAGHRVTVLHRGKTPGDLPDGISHLHGDCDALDDVAQAARSLEPDVLLHNIVLHDRHVADAQRVFRGAAGRLVMVSSMDVYRAYGRVIGADPGPPDPVPVDEESPLRDSRFPYRKHADGPGHRLWDYDKVPAEQQAMSDPDLPGTVLRLPMVLGPNDGQHRLYPFLRPMLDGRPHLVIQGSYARWRSTWGYVDHVADAIALACERPDAAGRVYNVADRARSMEALARDTAAAFGWSGEIVVRDDVPEPIADTEHDFGQHLEVSAARIAAELGWTPTHGWPEVIARTVAWERDHPPDPVPDYDPRYAAEDALLA